jgi:hypothetical protein
MMIAFAIVRADRKSNPPLIADFSYKRSRDNGGIVRAARQATKN